MKKLATNLGGTVGCTTMGGLNSGASFFFTVACKATKKKMANSFQLCLVPIESDSEAAEP